MIQGVVMVTVRVGGPPGPRLGPLAGLGALMARPAGRERTRGSATQQLRKCSSGATEPVAAGEFPA